MATDGGEAELLVDPLGAVIVLGNVEQDTPEAQRIESVTRERADRIGAVPPVNGIGADDDAKRAVAASEVKVTQADRADNPSRLVENDEASSGGVTASTLKIEVTVRREGQVEIRPLQLGLAETRPLRHFVDIGPNHLAENHPLTLDLRWLRHVTSRSLVTIPLVPGPHCFTGPPGLAHSGQ